MECSRCSFCCSQSLELIRHVFEAHSVDSDFAYTCPIAPCEHRFTQGASFLSVLTHMNRKHGSWREQIAILPVSLNDDQSEQQNPQDTGPFDPFLPPESLFASHPIATGLEPIGPALPPESSFALCPTSVTFDAQDTSTLLDSRQHHLQTERAAVLFLINLKEKYCLNQSTMNFVVKYINDIVQTTCESIKESVCSCLAMESIPIPQVFGDMFVIHPFENVGTEYLLTKNCRENLGLVVS